MTARTASTPLRQPAAVPQMSDDDLCINTVRTLAIDAVQKANSGHAGTPMALAPVVYTLWQEFLRYDPADPLWPNLAAYAEGFDILKHADSDARPPEERFALDLADIAEVWRRGSVISSSLLDLIASALAQDPKLEGYSGYVEDSGEGRWTIMAAIEQAVSADVLSAALYARFRSRRQHTFAEQILSAMHKGFRGQTEPDKAARP